jgi:hypothetical protein
LFRYEYIQNKETSESRRVCSDASTFKDKEASECRHVFFGYESFKYKEASESHSSCSDTSTYKDKEASERSHVCSNTSTFKDKEASEWCHVCSDTSTFKDKEASERCHRREIIYCKRAILCLLSSKILTPHPPLRPASVYPRLCWGGGHTRQAERGMGGQYFGRRET